MTDTRHRNVDWTLHPQGNSVSWEGVHAALLMDLRDELQRLNRLLSCGNFASIPQVLRDIRRHTTKPKQKIKS